MSAPGGRFIVFEGGEGSGKSTQAALLAERLGAVATHEPGATEVGRRLREVLLDPAAGRLSDRAEALLVAADRAQHVAEVIGPALARGDDVVCDRFTGSTLAYQGYGRGLDVSELARLSEWAAAGVEPDLVVLLEVDPAASAARLGRELDRMEAAGDAFHRRVAAGYRALAAADPDRWIVVDGVGSIEEVAARVWHAVMTRVPSLEPATGG
ncbi:MAG: dTMP kinase [Actinomycetota bacterium]|jgi:dTMP kinase|nr:dTMP kinase [Actinomycetota bacterium]